MKSFADMTYKLACQKAYKGQIKHPYVVYVKDDGMWGAMPCSMWKMVKVGTPRFYVSHHARGMNVALWECRDEGNGHDTHEG